MVNRLLAVRNLSNCYYAMRHGHSEANEAGIVVSDPKLGTEHYGLSGEGVDQVELALLKNHEIDRDTLIVSSDFKRAWETATLVHQKLNCASPLIADHRLRERFFGQYDGGSDSIYPKVWALDRIDPSTTRNEVESADAVMQRATELVVELEHEYRNIKILLVAHGDILQILQTAFAGLGAGQHRDQLHLETAEIRRLELAS